MKISNSIVTSKQNFIEKYHRLIKKLYFIFRLRFFTNVCHLNVQQLLSNLSHFVLFSQAHFKLTFGGAFIRDLRVVLILEEKISLLYS